MKSFVIGSGTVSIKYSSGIVTATDTQASYGNLCKYKQISRIYKFNNTLLSLSGEVSDIQELIKEIKIYTENDPVEISSSGYCRIIQRIMYNRRSKVEPLNVSCTVCGMDVSSISGIVNVNGGSSNSEGVNSNSKGSSGSSNSNSEGVNSNSKGSSGSNSVDDKRKLETNINNKMDTNDNKNHSNKNNTTPILCTINHLGNFYYSDVTATGMAHLIALPFLREHELLKDNSNITKQQAIELVEEAMRIMCYRSCRNSNQILLGVVDLDGAIINDTYCIETKWGAGYQNGEIVL